MSESHKPANQTAYPDTYHLTKEFARENRSFQTDAETVLWERIRRRSLGCRFRRQHIIGDYIADFICLEHKLIIEVDGGYHRASQQEIEDNQRSEWLNRQGYYVMRFTNEMVINETDFVVERIKEIIEKITSPFPPTPFP